jgi:hypothetical protein
VDAAGRRLFIKASPSRQESDAERKGHESISRFYKVPRLRGTCYIGSWTVLAYDRWPHLDTDAGLLLDEISRADLTGDTTRLDECLTDVLSRYRDATSRTLRRAPLAETVGKLYRDRARLAAGSTAITGATSRGHSRTAPASALQSCPDLRWPSTGVSIVSTSPR